jgi:AcrR family transcriptional regulator
MYEPNTRRKREYKQRIEYILDTAESIFAEQGFFRATMRQIALKAEFALGTIYSYFGSKKQLYGRVIETKVNELVNFVTGKMAEAPTVQGQVEKFVHTKMTFLHKNPAFLRLYFAKVDVPQLGTDHILPGKARKKYDSMLRCLTNVIQQGVREGFFRPMDAKVTTKVLDGLTNAFAISWLSSKSQMSIEADMRTVTELFLYGAAIRQEPIRNSK